MSDREATERLEAKLDLLEAENERLRTAVAHAGCFIFQPRHEVVEGLIIALGGKDYYDRSALPEQTPSIDTAPDPTQD